LIFVADRHFQFHRVVFLHDSTGGADASIQETLEPLIAIRGKVQNAIVRGDCERHTAHQAGRSTVFVRCGCGRGTMQHETCSIDHLAGDSEGIGRSGLAGSFGTGSLGKTIARVEGSIDQARLRIG